MKGHIVRIKRFLLDISRVSQNERVKRFCGNLVHRILLKISPSMTNIICISLLFYNYCATFSSYHMKCTTGLHNLYNSNVRIHNCWLKKSGAKLCLAKIQLTKTDWVVFSASQIPYQSTELKDDFDIIQNHPSVLPT